MFVDDTTIFIKGKNLSDVTASVSKELIKVNSWFCANLLSLNVKKTNYVLFGNKQIPDIDILINNEKINRVYETKFLGVIIQHNIKWHENSYLIKNQESRYYTHQVTHQIEASPEGGTGSASGDH